MRQSATSLAAISKNPPANNSTESDIPMSEPRSDALVFFGATGDLAYKKIFPGLQAMLKRGHLDVPVIGVARASWNLDQLEARARESLEKHGGGVDPLPLASFRDCCAMSVAIIPTRQRFRPCARSSERANGPRITSPFLPHFSDR